MECKHNLILNEEEDFVFCSKCRKRWDTSTTSSGTWIYPNFTPIDPGFNKPFNPFGDGIYCTCESNQ